MGRRHRLAFLAVALTLYAAAGCVLGAFVVGPESDTAGWLVLLGLPALLTAVTAAFVGGTIGEIVGTAFLSSLLSGLALVAFILWLASEGAFE